VDPNIAQARNNSKRRAGRDLCEVEDEPSVWPGDGTEIHPQKVVAYIDKVGLRIVTPLSQAEMAKLRRHCKVRELDSLPGEEQLLHLFQPPDRALRMLARRNDVFITRVEFALDWTFADPQQRDRAWRIFCSYSFKKHHCPRKIKVFKGTRYTDPRRAATNLIAYADRPSKATGDAYCVHIELRLTREVPLVRAGIESVRDLIGFDHRNFWRPRLHMRMLNFKRFGARYHKGPPDITRREFEGGLCLTYERSAETAGLFFWRANDCSVQNFYNKYRRPVKNLSRYLIPIPTDHLLPIRTISD
jgi:hypothetical protein